MFDYGSSQGPNPYAQQALMGMAQSPSAQGAFQFPQINSPQISAFPYADPYLTSTGGNAGSASQAPTSYYFGGNTATMTNPFGAAPQQQQQAPQAAPGNPAAPPAGSGQNNQIQPQSGGGFTYTPINSPGNWGVGGSGGFGSPTPINFGGGPMPANQIYGTGF